MAFVNEKQYEVLARGMINNEFILRIMNWLTP